MQTGIIGLPQVGKTSLFRILTRARVDARSAPNQAHVGVARVPDARLGKLAEVFRPKKVTHAAIEYVDIGGLQKDREKNSASLVPLREADALAHVVRLFENPAVPHEAGALDAMRDIESVDIELMLQDLEQAAKRIARVERDLKKKKEPLLEVEFELLTRCRQALEAETPLRELEFKPEEQKMLNGFLFLTRKPMLYVLNLGDEEAADIEGAVNKHHLERLASKPQTAVVPFCGKIEAELADLDDGEAAEIMRAYGLLESGRDRLIQASYRLLGLISFLTCGEPECRAWTIERGMSAQKAAGAIHSDIERGFIKAEVVNWEDLLKAGSFPAARERGQVRLEGKEYVVQEGDVILFRHSG
ncbi:MAG TPA: redox-regulated ATPase YchF [Verrucomicrobiae bacterium]|jgi:GTP-binding protein YchF|nr:redox-regulated ATPase YchF [Verrucomicrobiae bacterium]